MQRVLLLVLALAAPSLLPAAEPGERLRAFLAETTAFSAGFTQERSGGGGEPERATGTLRLKRPGQFRWDYVNPYAQMILADGAKLWIYDPDLAQVTVRPQDEALGNSPARLLSGGLDLDANFTIVEASAEVAGLHWVELRPLGGEEEFSRVRLGFDAIVLDKLFKRRIGFVAAASFGQIGASVGEQVADGYHFDVGVILKAERRAEAKAKGYEGEMCSECGNFTLVRNGTCMKCDTCGSTTGCS